MFFNYLNYLMTSLGSFQWFTFTGFCRLEFILYNMDLLILPSLVLAGFSNRSLELF